MADVSFVLVHGGIQGSWVWEELIQALKVQSPQIGARVVAVDVPGCGIKRGRATDGLGIQDIALELIDDIRQADLQDAVLVGHSQAGTIVPSMVNMAPDLFRHAVYVSCIAPQRGETVMAFSERWRLRPTSAGEYDVEAMFCNDMNEAKRSAFVSKLGHDAWPPAAYSHVDWSYPRPETIRGSYIFCLKDQTVSWKQQLESAQRLNAAGLACIDAGHQVMNTRPHALAEVLLRAATL